MAAEPVLSAIVGYRLVTQDPPRLLAFYTALGWRVEGSGPIAPEEMATLGLEGGGERTTLRLGPSLLGIDRFDRPGRPYPADATAADLVFQHLALVTDDAGAAWARAQAAGARTISGGDGAVTLPPSAGAVTAVKFRDPDGHPLELLQFPPGTRPEWAGEGLLGIDHSAVSVSDAGRSQAFYEAHGLRAAAGSLNQGPTQVALDGLDRVRVQVLPMHPMRRPPHLELLAYQQPTGRPHPPLRADDTAATRVVWRSDRAKLLADPDGHLHQLHPGG